MKIVCIAFATMCLFCSPTFAQVPKKVLDEMQYLVGDWESEGTFEGKPSKATFSAHWVPGKHCLALSFRNDEIACSGISGWDPATGNLVETWYRSDGVQAEHRYSDFSASTWKGTVRVTDAAGKSSKGTARLEKTATGFTFDGKTDDGKTVATRNRRLAAGDQQALARRWFEFLAGSWKFEYPALGIKGDNEYRPAADGAAIVATGSGADGTSVELIGYRANTKRIVFSGYGSKGNHWHTEGVEIGDRRIAGPVGGIMPDGREIRGTVELLRIDDNRFEVRLAGEVAGQKQTDTGVFTRKK